MKKISILARKEDQDKVLQTIQSFQNVEIIDLKDKVSSELLSHFERPQVESTVRKLSRQIDRLDENIAYLVSYVKPKSLWEKLGQGRENYTLDELYQQVHQLDVDLLLDTVQEQRDHILALEKDIDKIEQDEALLRQWQKLEMDPKQLKDLKFLKAEIGSIETKNSEEFVQAIQAMDGVAEEIYYTDEYMNYLVVVDKMKETQLEDLLNRFAFKHFDYPFVRPPQEALKNTLAYREQLIRVHRDARQRLRYNDQTLWNLKLVKEYIYNVREREKARELILNSSSLFMVSGWTPEEDVMEEIASIRAELVGQPLAILTEDVQLEEIDEVPIKLDNAHIIGPFESLTKQYSLPKYNAKDPTPFLYPFHILFFGMMSADLGYGMILWLLTFIPLKRFDLKAGTRQTLRFFHQLSYGTMAVGLFFGSFFGFNLPFKVWDITGNVIEVLILSVVFGIIHLFVGYTLKSVEAFKQKDWKSFYLDAVQWLLMLIGIVILGINMAFLNNQALLQKIGTWLIIGNVIGMIVVNIVASHNKLVGLGQGALGVIGVAGFMGDLISYTRLAALAISGANIGMAFNMIIGILPPIARFSVGIILFVVLHALNIFLTFLGAYVHDMRLEYVEFFGKFYEGGGKAFTPLGTLNDNINIKKEKR
ncbi:V-type ATP synthase subunit I [Ignavigranum ruoffiae]|uniref:V-type ATP synthase subunit I n=1 Tax=Ignavigranum ruoffiae TaxID=89093 RepID=UPI00206AC306|nr:V-type ATP synthase subunit I [Ignavigranum ruoffiae]UPQ85010.1 V-type ATP synthase subunit I [Ignavigranum ruoffiae]